MKQKSIGEWIGTAANFAFVMAFAGGVAIVGVHLYDMPVRMDKIEAAQEEEAKFREVQTMKEQETENVVKAILSVQQTQGQKLDAVCQAVGVPVGQNSLYMSPALAYKPSKNGNESQP